MCSLLVVDKLWLKTAKYLSLVSTYIYTHIVLTFPTQ